MGMNRRDFNRALLAATGGIIAAATVGCGDKKDETPSPATTQASTDGMAKAAHEMGLEKHICKAKNSCKGNGGCKSGDGSCAGKNTCKGKGGCATVKAHSCGGKNSCKGLGGCKSSDNGCKGKNSCDGKGGCAVPLKH